MKHFTRTIPQHTITVHDRWGKPELVTIPEDTFEVYPTLQGVYQRLFAEFGALFVNWQDGWLCPFNERTGTMNIRCVAGNRAHCVGLGFEVDKYTSHLPSEEQERLTNTIHCSQWESRLLDTLHEMDVVQHYGDWEDDVDEIYNHLLHKILQDSQCFLWQVEVHDRNQKWVYQHEKGIEYDKTV